jgi:predicted nucleic acid-binding protein
MPNLMVISNTSPIFYLHRLGQLELLRKLYQNIVIPNGVIEELKIGKRQGEDVPDISKHKWIEIQAAQVLALAIENPGSLVILDDRLAREIANSKNMRVTGTAGVILKAKQEGHIKLVRPIFESLKQLDFWISDALMDNIIRMAGE